MKIIDCVEFEVGTPQFRINEVIVDNADVPLYYFYGQQELEENLSGIVISESEPKKISTLDKVSTVNEGDVIFSLISGKATVVRKKNEGYLLTQNYIRLIPNKKIDKYFLVYLLNESKNIKKQFLVGMQGSIVLKYSVRQIRELELPNLPPIKTQKLIGELYFSQLRLEELYKRKSILQKQIIMKKIDKLL